jgi:hypothetical protein
MSTHRATIALALLAVSSISAGTRLGAQSTAPVAVGERVRITTPSQRGGYRYVGSVIGVQGDSVLLKTRDLAGPRSVAISDITALDISLGERGNTRRGLLYGSVIGAGLGAALAAATSKTPECAGATWFCGDAAPNRTGDAVAGGILGALTGVIVGGLWGATHPSEHWVRRSLGNGARVGIAPMGRGLGVTLAARF